MVAFLLSARAFLLPPLSGAATNSPDSEAWGGMMGKQSVASKLTDILGGSCFLDLRLTL
jgi:hypothetical protein